jgi:hypothetical protein
VFVFILPYIALFVWLINHQPAVLFSQNKSAPAISHQPNEQAEKKSHYYEEKFDQMREEFHPYDTRQSYYQVLSLDNSTI